MTPLVKRRLLQWFAGQARQTAMERAGRAGGRFLELGVGAGRMLGEYRGAIEVTGIDWREGELKFAVARVSRGFAPRVNGVALAAPGVLPFAKGEFDGALAAASLSAAPDPAGAFAELTRVVRPGGEIIIVDHFAADADEPYPAEAEADDEDRPGALISVTDLITAPGASMTTMRRLLPAGLYTLVCLRMDAQAAVPRADGAEAGERAAAVAPRVARRRRAERREGPARRRAGPRRRLTG